MERRGRGTRTRGGGKAGKKIVLALYAVWVACIMLASAGYLAESGTRKMVAEGEFSYNPVFDHDGEIKHYVVQRADPSEDAEISIEYRDSTRTTVVNARNILELEVDCLSIARAKHVEILGESYVEDSDDYIQFFKEREVIYVNCEVDSDMNITWVSMPVPTMVTEDGEEIEFRALGDTIKVQVSEGNHQVVLYFTRTEFPTAAFTVDHPVTGIDSPVGFDSSASNASGGKDIDRRVWDFGDDTESAVGNDVTVTHNYLSAGTYTVTLTVRDDEGLKDSATQVVEVLRDLDQELDLDGDGDPDWTDEDLDGDGVVNTEDAFPWDPLETVDTDGDEVGDNSDAFPEDPDEQLDSDDDGVGDNADPEPFNPEVGGLDSGKEGGDEEGNLIMPILLAVILIVVVAGAGGGVAAARSAKARKAAAAPPTKPAPGPAPAAADIGFTPPPKPAPGRSPEPEPMLEPVTEPVLAAEADVEMLEPVMERGGPYDTEGMSKAEYLDSLDTIMRDEYGYSDEEVEKALDILEEEIAQEVG